MKSSLGDAQPELIAGNVDTGLDEELFDELKAITRRSQSTDECFYCPVARGCAWCSAYNYQVFGTVNKRATFICWMHKARSLANVYFWNKKYLKNDIRKSFAMYLPEEDALRIIDENTLVALQGLVKATQDKLDLHDLI